MTDRDLTPEEARAEVEAFLGPEWLCGTNSVFPGAWATRDLLCLEIEDAPTYRAAVDALKAAWRDAVRPWVVEAFSEGEAHGIGEMNHKNDVGASEERAAVRIARVLGEDA